MKKRILVRAAVCTLSALICAVSVPASAAESGVMTFRMSAEKTYLTASSLADADAVIPGGMYIDCYTGISYMKLRMKSDAPLILENADFTRDPNRTEQDGTETVAKPCYFVSHGSTTFTQYSEETGALMNTALWYGPGAVFPGAGVVENPESSFLRFDVRVPQGTAPGVYKLYLSRDVVILSSGIHLPDMEVRDADNNEITVPCEDCEIIVEPAALRGDADCDGKITVLDAQTVLRYYGDVVVAQREQTEEMLRQSLQTPYIHTSLEAANVDSKGDAGLEDAMAILRYAGNLNSGIETSWDACIR